MDYRNKAARVNLKVLIVLIVVSVALGVSLVAARQVRRSILSKMDLQRGTTAFEEKDWKAACRHFQEYLGRNPDDVDILKKYAVAQLAGRPLNAPAIGAALSAYRRILQLDPHDEIAGEELAALYAGTGNFVELAYVARRWLDHEPNDLKAALWLADAQIRMNKTSEAEQTLLDVMRRCDANDHAVEYAQACLKMAVLRGRQDYRPLEREQGGEDPNRPTTALGWLNLAVERAPNLGEVWVSRAQFCREHADSMEVGEDRALALARADLEAASDLDASDPRVSLVLCAEWMAHGELDRAASVLQDAEDLPSETIQERFLDINTWTASKFVLASELALRQGATAEGVSLADEVLETITEGRQRIGILPYVIRLYLAAGRAVDVEGVPDANECLDEYIDLQYTQEETSESKLETYYLRALLARYKGEPYDVIDALQPVVASGPSDPRLWQLLAEAFAQTEQTRRAVDALVRYLRLRPRDPQMTLQLAREYVKLRDWNRALETAQLAESLNPTDVTSTVLRLLRIEATVYVAEKQHALNETRLAELASELAELRETHPRHVDVRILQAMIAMYRERPEEAEEELKLAIEQCEEPLRAEMQLVRHYQSTKRVVDAIRLCRDVCERHAVVAEPWLALSRIHAAARDYDAARSCLREALNAVVGRWEKRSVSIGLALLELMHGDRTVGIDLLMELAARDVREVRARTLLLGIREVQQDQVLTARLLRELRQAEGESGLMWRFYQASSWLSSDGWRSKQENIAGLLQHCIDTDPEWPAPALRLADMYERLGDLGRVEVIYRQALARNPSAPRIADRLMLLLERQNRLSDAEQVLQDAETDPRVVSTWHVRTALRAGEFARATEELELQASNDEQDTKSRILLARLVYWQNRDAGRAFAYLDEAEDITPGSLAVMAARVSILKAEGQTAEAQRLLDDNVAGNGDFNAYMARASYMASTGEFERAEEDYRRLTAFAEYGVTGYLLLSDFYAKNERPEEAIAALEEGLQVHPDDLQLKRTLMKTLLARRRPQDQEEALGILAELEEQLPNDPELMKLRALQLLSEKTQQSQTAAIEKLEEVVKLEPTAVDAHLMLTSLAMQTGRYQDARDATIRALGSNPGNSALLAARSGAEFELNNTRLAAELAQLALEQDPNNATARSVLVAAALKSEGHLFPIVTDSARRWLEKDPEDVAALSTIVAVALQTKNRDLLEEARALVEAMTSVRPMDEGVLLLQARVMLALDQPQVAIPRLEAYCQSEAGSNSVNAIVTLADLYRVSGDMDRAGQWLDRAEQTAPDDLTTIHGRCVWLVVQKRFDELAGISTAYISAKGQDESKLISGASILSASDSAQGKKEGLKLFEHTAALFPESLEAQVGLASALFGAGRAEQAEDIYRRLLERHPLGIRILNDLAWILQEHEQDYEAALELANRGLQLEPENQHLLDTRGVILSKMNARLAEAKVDFEDLVRLSPPDSARRAKALLQLGRVYAKLQDLKGARLHLNRALEIDRKIAVFTPAERSEIMEMVQNGAGQRADREMN